LRLLYKLVAFYVVLGLAFGVFYQEYTKHLEFTDETVLSVLHVHTLVLGAIFFIILMLMENQLTLTAYKRFNAWLIIYNIGLLGVLTTLTIRGLLQVQDTDISGLNHIAGTFHFIFGVAWIWFLVILKKVFKL